MNTLTMFKLAITAAAVCLAMVMMPNDWDGRPYLWVATVGILSILAILGFGLAAVWTYAP